MDGDALLNPAHLFSSEFFWQDLRALLEGKEDIDKSRLGMECLDRILALLPKQEVGALSAFARVYKQLNEYGLPNQTELLVSIKSLLDWPKAAISLAL